MRLVFTADLHGNIESYQALLDLASSSGAQAAIVGGDLLPHAIHREGAVEAQRAFVDHQLRPLLAAFRSQFPRIRVFLLPGNDDWAAAASAGIDALATDDLVVPLHERVLDLMQLGLATQPLWLAGYACVPLTPFSIKDYERRDDRPLPPFSFAMAFASWSGTIQRVSARDIMALPSIGEALATLATNSDVARTIYVCHTPPANTPLDAMSRGRHPGSIALRQFIEARQPLLTLHGHIHEAPTISGQFAITMGTTWCANPGHDPKRFHALTLDTDDIAGTIEHTVFGRPSQPKALR